MTPQVHLIYTYPNFTSCREVPGLQEALGAWDTATEIALPLRVSPMKGWLDGALKIKTKCVTVCVRPRPSHAGEGGVCRVSCVSEGLCCAQTLRSEPCDGCLDCLCFRWWSLLGFSLGAPLRVNGWHVRAHDDLTSTKHARF